MSKPQIRSSQLITIFGPGAMLDLPDDAVIIAGIDSWRYNRNTQLPIVEESRLQKKIEKLTGVQGITLRKPPASIEDRGFTPDITAYRFPEWFIVQRQTTTPQGYRARRLVHLNDLDRGKFRDDDNKRYPVVPVRFVRACPRGHVGDIDWHSFVHITDTGCRRELQMEERGTSGDLDSIWVRCACDKERVMSLAARMGSHSLGSCNGSRPWLGPGTKEACGQPNRLLTRNASNAYFSQLMSVISIPDILESVDAAVRALWASHLSAVQTEAELEIVCRIPLVNEQLEEFSSEQIMASIQHLRDGSSLEDRPVKEVEFDALTSSDEEFGSDKPDGDFYARVLPKDKWIADWMSPVRRIVLVHRLREVVSQIGFSRFEAAGPDIHGELDIEVKAAPLGLDVSWLPAVENRGEGIFIEFDPNVIEEWLSSPAIQERDTILQSGFRHWLVEHEGSRRQYPRLPYYLLHSISHLLMTTISLECGYPASSIRERIYAAPNRYGILIYTGSSDAEGTLGGLVDEGRRIKFHIRRALERGRLCSNDPVCAFHAPHEHDHQPLLGSACHGCLLVSETSCEQHNDFLDRALVVQTVEGLGIEFFHGALYD